MKSSRPWVTYLVAGALLVVALGLMLWFFEQLPIEGTALGIDLRGVWEALQGGRPRFGPSPGFYNPPWIAVLLLPLGWMSFRAAWGLVTLATLAVLLVSLPPTRRRWQRWLGMVLLVASFLTLRTIADGNVEFLVIGGVLLVLHGYAAQSPLPLAAGILLATAKIQEVWLLMLVVGIAVLRTWPRERWLRLGGWLLLVLAPSLLWLGPDWLRSLGELPYRGSLTDSSLVSSLARLGVPGVLTALAWVAALGLVLAAAWRLGPQLSRLGAALLVAASMLLAPYVAGNSFLTVLAIGVLPLVLAGDLLGIGLLVLANLPILAPRDLMVNYSAYYWTGLLILAGGVFAWRAMQQVGPETKLKPVSIVATPGG